MIPTAIFVNDGNNSELIDLASQMQNICRVIQRTSIQGEQLYKMFEGVLFLGATGQTVFTRQDEYSDVVKSALFHLSKLDKKNKAQLLKYLKSTERLIPERGNPQALMDEETFYNFISFPGSLSTEND
jgi:hypothetical protein